MGSSRAPTFTELLGTLIRYFYGEVIVGSYGVSQYTGFWPFGPAVIPQGSVLRPGSTCGADRILQVCRRGRCGDTEHF